MGDVSDPIVVMGICGSYDLDSANGRMLEIVLEEATENSPFTEDSDKMIS